MPIGGQGRNNISGKEKQRSGFCALEFSNGRTHQSQDGGKDALSTKNKLPEMERTMEKLYLARVVHVAPMTEKKVKKVKASALFILVDPRVDVVLKYKVCLANCVDGVLREKPFEVFLSEFCEQEQRFP